MQGWSDGADPPGLAQDLRPQHHRAHGPHLHLLLWVLRLQKRSPLHVRVPIRGKPHVQDKPTLGLLLVLSKTKSVFNLFFFPLGTSFFLLKIDFRTENAKLYRQKWKMGKFMEHKQSHDQKGNIDH
jgi:hypothetical protein